MRLSSVFGPVRRQKNTKAEATTKSLRANAGPKSGKTEMSRENQGEMDKES